jgi:hypothetical protein
MNFYAVSDTPSAFQSYYILPKRLPSIAEKTKSMTAMAGYLPMFYEEASGKVFLQISKMNEELLYHISLPQGLGSNDIGLDRGLQGGGRIVKFERAGRKILLVQPNYDFRAQTNDAAERRSVEQSFASSTLWGFTAEAETEGACACRCYRLFTA